MKAIGMGLLWAIALMWLGNYVAASLGVTPVATAAIAVAAGAAVSAQARLRSGKVRSRTDDSGLLRRSLARL